MPGEIVWLASYMKSGNTWLRLLLANLLSGRNEPVDINDIGLTPLSATRRDDIEDQTLVDSSLLARAELDALIPCITEAIAMQTDGFAFIKMHDAYRRNARGEPVLGRNRVRAALYVLRDPRDVVISLSHHSGITLDDAIRQINRLDWKANAKARRYTPMIPQVPLDWSSNVESWVDQQDIPVLVIRYENMLMNTAKMLKAIADFLDLDVTQERVEHAVRCADFKALQHQERKAGFRERIPVRGEAAPFFRSGRSGTWREALTAAQEQAIIDVHRRVMLRFGYLSE